MSTYTKSPLVKSIVEQVTNNATSWIGHPTFDNKNIIGGQTFISPSEIIKLTDSGDGKFQQQTVYVNDGSEISASSVGAVYKRTLLIGPVFQRHFVLAREVDN